ncbi:MAG: universal stress protein [Bacteroidota bacterium]
MEEIIVPIDFSECSINAFEHALDIAAKTKHDLELLWVKSNNSKNELIKDKGEKIDDVVTKRFEEILKKYQPKLVSNKLSYKIREGKVYKEVVTEAKEKNAFLIVTGTHGSSGFEEIFIGSNANRIIASSQCPIITIRGGVNVKKPLTGIVLPMDSSDLTRQKVPFTLELAKFYHAEIFILGVISSKIKALAKRTEVYVSQVEKSLYSKNIKHQVEIIRSDNPTEDIIKHCQKVEANLISIMTEQEKSSYSFILGTYAQQLVNRSPYPVLSIHPKDVMITYSR